MRVVPPGGFAGFSQMAPASQSALTKGTGGGGGRRRRKAKKSAAPKRRRRKASKSAAPKRRRKSRGGKLKKGSAAAKARMAKLRRMRKK